MDAGKRSRSRSSRRKSTPTTADDSAASPAKVPRQAAAPQADSRQTGVRGSAGKGSGEAVSDSAVKEEPVEAAPTPEAKSFPFKNAKFVHSALQDGEKVKRYGFKNLKQILQLEAAGNYSGEDRALLYSQVAAPPSRRPPLKVSDLSGLPTSYQDPKTGLRYATGEEFALIRTMPPDIVAAYLNLRGVPTYSVRS